jgi:membrane associated rhomboid family serine protease
MGLAERDYSRGSPDSSSQFAALGASSATTWLIAIIVAGFILNALLTPPSLMPYLVMPEHWGSEFQSGEFLLRVMGTLARWTHFSVATVVDDLQLWRVLTFQFVHTDVWPLFINVVCLYAFGRVLEEEIGRGRFAALFFICSMAAPATYLALYAAGVKINAAWMPLVGASSGVLGITIVAACAGPDDQVVLWTTGLMVRRRALAWIIAAVVALIVIKQDSTGANVAQLGGIVVGLFAVPVLKWRRGPF